MAHGSYGFTLTELMIAVAILAVVIIATSKIFGTASKVTAIGQANANVLQESAAIQRLIQDDLNRISREGFLGIRCVAVRNDINVPDGGPLLNPLRPADAEIRADQLVFFRTGLAGIQTSRIGGGIHHKGQGTTAMIYYGHGFQLLDGLATDVINDDTRRPHDPLNQVTPPSPPSPTSFGFDPDSIIVPWYRGEMNMVRTLFRRVGSTGDGFDIFSSINDNTIDGTQPEARQWLLCRQQIALTDDDKKNPNTNSKTVYLGRNATARSVFYEDPSPPGFSSHEIRNGRIDAAATLITDIRKRLYQGYAPDSSIPPNPLHEFEFWRDIVRPRILDQIMLYPRAERTAPSMDRTDQSLTNHVLASACSSFRIEWTYAPGTGAAQRANGAAFSGHYYPPNLLNQPIYPSHSINYPHSDIRLMPTEQPWFGWLDIERGVFPYRTPIDWGATLPPQLPQPPSPDVNFPWWVPSTTIGWYWDNSSSHYKNNFDHFEIYDDPFTRDPPVKQYSAIFGFNQNTPLNDFGDPDINLLYTPWPTALRITITLHDPDLKLERGREIQFIVNLPQRSN